MKRQLGSDTKFTTATCSQAYSTSGQRAACSPQQPDAHEIIYLNVLACLSDQLKGNCLYKSVRSGARASKRCMACVICQNRQRGIYATDNRRCGRRGRITRLLTLWKTRRRAGVATLWHTRTKCQSRSWTSPICGRSNEVSPLLTR